MCERCLRNRTVIMMWSNRTAIERGYASITDACQEWLEDPVNKAMLTLSLDDPKLWGYTSILGYMQWADGLGDVDLSELAPWINSDENWRETMSHADHLEWRKKIREHPYFQEMENSLGKAFPETMGETMIWAESELPFDDIQFELSEEDLMELLPTGLREALQALDVQFETVAQNNGITVVEGIISLGAEKEEGEEIPILPPMPDTIH